MIDDIFKTIDISVEEIIFKEKSSKFIGYAFPVKDEETIKNHLETVKKLHYSARHWCYAWQLGHGTNKRHRANDDGEPNNSAGIPIYGQIQSFDLTDILVVVVRYFGGVKLGVGGLVQAYKTSAQLTLNEAVIVEKQVTDYIYLRFDYKDMNKVMRIAKERNVQIVSQKMEMDCQLTIEVRQSETQSVVAAFSSVYGVEIRGLDNLEIR